MVSADVKKPTLNRLLSGQTRHSKQRCSDPASLCCEGQAARGNLMALEQTAAYSAWRERITIRRARSWHMHRALNWSYQPAVVQNHPSSILFFFLPTSGWLFWDYVVLGINKAMEESTDSKRGNHFGSPRECQQTAMDNWIWMGMSTDCHG